MLGFFRNKHVVVAVIVTPILALIAYVLVDTWLREKPHRAQPGFAYPLAAQSNCRYSSGRCSLVNADLKVVLEYEKETGAMLLSSSHSLTTVAIGYLSARGIELESGQMLALDETGNRWRLDLATPLTQIELARVALRVEDVFYYAETSLQFTHYQTGFDKDFRNKKQ